VTVELEGHTTVGPLAFHPSTLRRAVLSFDGFLGIGSDYYPIPWDSLKYDTSLGGYRTTITE
jgi:hypothetical protein